MKQLLLQSIVFALLSLTTFSQKLSPGSHFPQVTLPSVATGKPTAFKSLTGEKMMLHIFASW